MHEQRQTKNKREDVVPKGAVPAYLLDRYTHQFDTDVCMNSTLVSHRCMHLVVSKIAFYKSLVAHTMYSLVPRFPDLFNVSACNIEKLGIGPGNEAILCTGTHLCNLLSALV